MTTTPMNSLFDQLLDAGIPKAFAKKRLPEWWSNDIANSSDSGLQQAKLYFCRAFNLDLKSLSNTTSKPLFRSTGHKFKLNKNILTEEVNASAHYANAMARIAIVGASLSPKPLLLDPADLRDQILLNHPCVNLQSLLSFCASSGISVIHIDKMPGKKMTALAVRIDDRFAIVISRMGHPSASLFHLAHELGHIANNHLPQDGFLVDQSINGKDVNDAEEKEADAFAIRLLNGAATRYSSSAALRPRQLYSEAVRLSREKNVDEGHIILNYGYTQGNFSVANAALKLIDTNGENGGDIINRVFFKDAMDCERLSEDQLNLLKTATNYS